MLSRGKRKIALLALTTVAFVAGTTLIVKATATGRQEPSDPACMASENAHIGCLEGSEPGFDPGQWQRAGAGTRGGR